MTSEQSKVTGGCLCGAVRYESDRPPVRVGYCHCRMCQKGLGNLFGTFALFRPKHFHFLEKEPTWFASSSRVKRGFCAHCGSPIAYQRDDSDHIAIWLGTLDQPEAYEPQFHGHTESKIPWVDIHSELPDETTNLPSYQSEMAAREES